MGASKGEDLDRLWADKVKRNGLNLERLDAYMERLFNEEVTMLKRISFKRNGAGWRVIITANVSGEDRVQFADVDNLASSGGKLLNMLQQPIWKVDAFSKSAPNAEVARPGGPLTKG